MNGVGVALEQDRHGRLLESSASRGWRGILAELRSHPVGEVRIVSSSCTEVATLIRGGCTVTRTADALARPLSVARGTIWLCAAGPEESFTVTYHEPSDVLHVYLPANPFSVLESGLQLKGASSARVHHHAGFHDLLIGQITDCVLIEMRKESAAGKILIESLTSSLAARLLQCYSNVSDQRLESRWAHNRLAHGKLRQVLDFIEAHIEDNIAVEQLASLACLSQYHFAREFKAATGRSPYQHVTERRLVHAKALLTRSNRSLNDIAQACGFPSQGNFWRAFRRATGATPGRYRAQRTGLAEQSVASLV